MTCVLKIETGKQVLKPAYWFQSWNHNYKKGNSMKKLIIATMFMMTVCATVAEARYTHSYFRGDGTYVNGYYGS